MNFGGSTPLVLHVLRSSVFRSASPMLIRPPRLPTTPELQQIVRRAEQLPLTGTGLFPSSHEPITASDVLDLPEHRFDRVPSCLV